MRYKSKVLKRFPQAALVVLTRWEDMKPRYYAVFNGGDRLDIYEDSETSCRGAGAAWRSAHFWCVRNSDKANKLVLPVDQLPDGDGWTLTTGNTFRNVWERR